MVLKYVIYIALNTNIYHLKAKTGEFNRIKSIFIIYIMKYIFYICESE